MKNTVLQVLGVCFESKLRYWSKCCMQIYRAYYGVAVFVFLCGTPIWRQERSVTFGTYFGHLNDWSSFFNEKQLHKHIFQILLCLKWLKIMKYSKYFFQQMEFSTNAVALCQPLLLSQKVVNMHISIYYLLRLMKIRTFVAL